MYKNASRNLQNYATRLTQHVLGGMPTLTDEEQYESLKESYKNLIAINQAETDKKKKKIYGKQLQDMMHEIGIYREKVKAKRIVANNQINDYILAIFKERCTKEEWVEIVSEARRRALS